MKLSIAIIGYKNHAARLIDLVDKNEFCQIDFVYHPHKKIDHPKATNKLEDLYQCDALIIASPNDTHFDYLIDWLKNSSGFVFCEKPPVTSLEDLQKLESLSEEEKGRIYFDYNFRFGVLNEVLQNENYLQKLGHINHIEIVNTHGLAFKPEYKNSWRADGEKNLHAITETVAIHYLDLLGLSFGKIRSFSYQPKIIAGTGTAYDTAYINLDWEKTSASILVSYACPAIEEYTIIGTDGILKISQEELRLYYPRDTFDEQGFFQFPPLAETKKLSTEKEYENSLKKSLDFFLQHVKDKQSIEQKYFTTSLDSNKILLEMTK